MVVDQLNHVRRRFEPSIYACCVMPDHVHTLVRLETGRHTLGSLIGAFKSLVDRQWRAHGNKAKLWQSRYYDHVLRPDEARERAIDHILNNPLRKGLVREPEEYPYSGSLDPW